jgi:hypothetical protein
MPRIDKALEIVRLAKELGDYDSNVIGMAAEVIAEEAFAMTRLGRGARTIDGYWSVNGSNESVKAGDARRGLGDGVQVLLEPDLLRRMRHLQGGCRRRWAAVQALLPADVMPLRSSRAFKR